MYSPDDEKEDKPKKNPLPVMSVDETKKYLETQDKQPVSKAVPPFVKDFIKRLKGAEHQAIKEIMLAPMKASLHPDYYEDEEREAIQSE